MHRYLSGIEDSAAVRFYEELENGRFMSTRCPACGHTFFPPRILCPGCLGRELEWVELSGRGTLHAFSRQYYSLAHRAPEVVGAVDLDDGVGRIFSLIDAPFDELRIGRRLKVGYFKSVFGMTLHKFKPV